MIMIARTDVRGVSGGSVDEVIRRGKAFMDAGIDVFFPEGLLSLDELERVGREVGAPLLYNRTFISPDLSLEDLKELRILYVGNAVGTLQISAHAMWEYMHGFAKGDIAFEVEARKAIEGHPVADFHRFVGFPEYAALENEYLPKTTLEKYDGSLGYDARSAAE
jgi:2-methylisocitrate lyase-like PEP mutase family enzyme